LGVNSFPRQKFSRSTALNGLAATAPKRFWLPAKFSPGGYHQYRYAYHRQIDGTPSSIH
jgi:hypothetical protein